MRWICLVVTVVLGSDPTALANQPDAEAEARKHEMAQAKWRAAVEAAEERDFRLVARSLEFVAQWGNLHLQVQATRNLPYVRRLIERPHDVGTRIRFAQEFWGFATPSQGPGSLRARRFMLEALPLAATFREASVVRAHILMYSLAAEELELAVRDVDRIVSASGVDSWDAAQARKSLARAFLVAGKCDRAVALLRQTIESQAPADEVAMSRVMLAEAYEKLGDTSNMIEQLDFVLFDQDERSKFVCVAKSLAAERLGDYFLRRGEPGRALTYFTAWVPTGGCGTCVELATSRKAQCIGACREALMRSNVP